MADRSRGGDPAGHGEPEYDWLYGEGDPSRRGSRPSRDPEPTQMLPTMNRPGAPSGGRSAGPAQEPPPPRWAGPPPDAPVGPPPRRSWEPADVPPPPVRRGHSIWWWLRLALLLWVVFLIAVPLWAWSKVDKVNADPSGARPPQQPGTTYLLVGSDSRAGLTRKQEISLGTGRASGRRTDTIMLLHTGAGPNLLMSIPRDSIVDIPGYGRSKINAAFAYGGPKLLVKTIESETGIRIDDYVEIGFAGFVNVVDAVGGIQICPTTAMKDRLANLDIRKGCQHVDGKVALGYARSRHVSGLGDIDRAHHQREVVSAVGHEAVSPLSILNPVRYFRLASAGADSLVVGKGTSPLDLAKFAWAMTRVNGKNGLTCGVPISDLAVHWDRARALALFKLIKEDRTADITKNLCGASGLPG